MNETQASSEEYDQDESDLHTLVESYDEVVNKRNFPTFKVLENGDFVRFELGMEFTSKDLVNDTVKDHVMETRKNLWFKKNDAVRVVEKCLPT